MATKKTVKKVAKRAASPAPSKTKALAVVRSFQLIKEKTPFMTYQVTPQTVYWAILFVYIMILSLWILNIQLDTLRIIDKINTL